ncbi:MAG: tetratricopeptide repeat protein [Saprospiraceae bacterium]|nr:tetratricopeptide repeat protein [Saprospiraceae bacterium]
MSTHLRSQFLLFPIALAVWCAPTAGRAQTTRLDSLKQLTTHKTDTIRIDALIALGRELRKKDLDQALMVQVRAKEAAAATGHTDRQAKASNDMGISYGMKEDYANSMEQFKQSLRLHAERGNQMGVADGYNNLAIVYKHIGDYSQSLDAHLRALEIYDALGDQSGRATSLLNIGVAYDLMKEPQKALEYFEPALEIKAKINDEPGKALVLHNMALIYETQKQYEKALTYLFEHLEILEKTNNQMTLANSLNSVGKVYLSMGDYAKAAVYLNQSREKAAKLGLREPLIHALHNLAKIHIQQGEPSRAIPLLEEHIRLADGLKSFLLKRQGHDLMATAYEQTNNFKSALRQAQLAAAYQDSLFNTERTQAYQQWQARLEVYEKDRQLDQQTQELQLLEARARSESQLR